MSWHLNWGLKDEDDPAMQERKRKNIPEWIGYAKALKQERAWHFSVQEPQRRPVLLVILMHAKVWESPWLVWKWDARVIINELTYLSPLAKTSLVWKWCINYIGLIPLTFASPNAPSSSNFLFIIWLNMYLYPKENMGLRWVPSLWQ